jgi:transposase
MSKIDKAQIAALLLTSGVFGWTCSPAAAVVRIKLLWWDGTGICLLAKRLEDRQFRWPVIADGMMRLTPAQLSTLLGRSVP